MNNPETDNVIPVEEMQRRRWVSETSQAIAECWQLISLKVLALREHDVPTADWVDVAVRNLSKQAQEKVGVRGAEVLPILVDLIVTSFARKPGEESPPLDFGAAIKAGMGLSSVLDFGGVIKMLAALAGSAIRNASMDDGGTENGSVTVAATPDEVAQYEKERLAHLVAAKSPGAHRIQHVIDRLFAEAPKLTTDDDLPVAGQAPAIMCHVSLKNGQQIEGSMSVTPEGTLRVMTPNQRVDARRQPIGDPVMIESFFDYEDISSVAVIREIAVERKSNLVT